MVKRSARFAILAGILAAGCGGVQGPMLDVGIGQNFAMQAAVRRGRYELACPEAIGSVLSSNLLQSIQWGGAEDSEYTIAVAGCGKRATYMVTCAQAGGSCFAAAVPGGRTP